MRWVDCCSSDVFPLGSSYLMHFFGHPVFWGGLHQSVIVLRFYVAMQGATAPRFAQSLLLIPFASHTILYAYQLAVQSPRQQLWIHCVHFSRFWTRWVQIFRYRQDALEKYALPLPIAYSQSRIDGTISIITGRLYDMTSVVNQQVVWHWVLNACYFSIFL